MSNKGDQSTAKAEKKDLENDKLVHEGWTDIKEKKRASTDVLFFLILLCAWFAMTIIGLIVTGRIQSTSNTLSMGNPYRLINAVDYTNHICGFDNGVSNLLYGYYLPDKTVVCVSNCPTTQSFTSFICHYDLQQAVDNDKTGFLGFYYLSREQCMYKLQTTVVLNRCVPTVATNAAAQAFATHFNLTGRNATIVKNTAYPASSTSASYISLFWQDVLVLIKIIAPLGLGMSTVVAFGYLYFLRIPGMLYTIIWTILFAIQAIFVVFSILLYVLYTNWSKDGIHTQNEVTAMQVFAIFGFFAAFFYFCFLIVMRKRIQLAINIIKEACRAMATMPILIFMPVAQVFGVALFLIPWFIYMIYLASSGDMVTMTATNAIGQTYNYRQFVYTKNTQYTFIFMLFCWFWTAEFVIAIGQLMIALAVVGWYFTREKEKITNGTVFWALHTTCRYHLGTVAFGSLIIALVKTARAIFAYIQKHAKASENKVAEYLLCCLQCCMWCVEKCMKFVNKNAYIQTAIFGYSFCKAARCAFFLIARNILRVAAVNMVGDFVLLLGKLLVPSLTTFLAYLIIAYGIPSNTINFIIAPLVGNLSCPLLLVLLITPQRITLQAVASLSLILNSYAVSTVLHHHHNNVLPLMYPYHPYPSFYQVLVWLLSYFVSCIFTEIFGMTIDTILCCYVADEEMFSSEKRFADGGLAEVIASSSTTTTIPVGTKAKEGTVTVDASHATTAKIAPTTAQSSEHRLP